MSQDYGTNLSLGRIYRNNRVNSVLIIFAFVVLGMVLSFYIDWWRRQPASQQISGINPPRGPARQLTAAESSRVKRLIRVLEEKIHYLETNPHDAEGRYVFLHALADWTKGTDAELILRSEFADSLISLTMRAQEMFSNIDELVPLEVRERIVKKCNGKLQFDYEKWEVVTIQPSPSKDRIKLR